MVVGTRPTQPELETIDFVARLPVRQRRQHGPESSLDLMADVAKPEGGSSPTEASTNSTSNRAPKQAAKSPAPATGAHMPLSDRSTAAGSDVWGPPENVDSAAIYKLYRGATGEVNDKPCRIWVDFPALQLCCAGYDLPAASWERRSLLDLTSCKLVPSTSSATQRLPDAFTVEVSSRDSNSVHRDDGGLGGEVEALNSPPILAVAGAGSNDALKEFSEALSRLLQSRDSEGQRGLEFIQKRLFQYLWRHQGTCFTEEALYEAQAVLAFNLEPKQGVAYLRGKLGKVSDKEVGIWLAQMSTQKGGLDPTMLGAYFSRRDTLEVFKSFVTSLEFRECDLVGALRLLFDTFKPGGEGQVITRILEMFAEAYYLQWSDRKDSIEPKTNYKHSESVEQVAVSLIMLNTGLHVAPKKNPGKRLTCAAMTVEEYIDNTRRVVGQEEVPEDALRQWYEAVKQVEISVEPLPRAAFSKLPVQPDIEGWLVAVSTTQVHRRYWAVLALQRLYLFSDANEVEPADAIDLKDAKVVSVADDKTCKDRFNANIHRSRSKCWCLATRGRADLVDADIRAFEVTQLSKSGSALLQKVKNSRTRLTLVAESADLMEKWVSLISSGPY
mmetsp:Transcript_112375/g.324616  ORF Transcript_112375/g.324616 Transcript_112375/m.324616 type:complete len:612 (-) Transcript_112375:93-1928(-)